MFAEFVCMNSRSPLARPWLAAACVIINGLIAMHALGQPAPPQPPANQSGSRTGAQAPPPGVQKAAEQWDIAVRLHRAKKLPEAIAAYKEFLRRVYDAKLPASTALPAYQNLTTIYR